MTYADFAQSNGLLGVITPLERGRLLLREFKGKESMNEPFQYELEMLSIDEYLPLRELVGEAFTVIVRQDNSLQERYFNGIVKRISHMPCEGRLVRYRVELAPTLWFLNQTSDCRIFQNLTVPEIVEQIFKDFGIHNVSWRLSRSYESWDYCVQYRETALNFVSRLLEQEGISYYFLHGRDSHTLVLADGDGSYSAFRPDEEVELEHSFGGGVNRSTDRIFTWRRQEDYGPTRCALRDFNFLQPDNKLHTEVGTIVPNGTPGEYELFDYPGEYEWRAGGQEWVRTRMEEEETLRTTAMGDGNCREFGAGLRFTLRGHPRPDQDGNYVLTTVTHHATEGHFFSNQDTPGSFYENTFTAVPSGRPLRPLRKTPKPFVQGTQTAIVVGPKDEEIFTNEHGQVKVQFHWDRRGTMNEASSCWIRVSYPWAGQGWGAISIPRIGQEVIVDFLEGDPDRPIITGRVYNAAQRTPFPLPSKKNVSGVVSRSTKGGGGYNEISFDDTKDKEMLVIHAQKDMASRIEHDQSLFVGNDRSGQIVNNDTMAVGNDRQTSIGNNDTTQVQNNSVLLADNILLNAKTSITLQTGASRIHMNQAGVIVIEGMLINIAAGINTNVTAPLVTVSGMGVMTTGVVTLNTAASHNTFGGVTNIHGAPVNINS